jgi:hypothetical protein
VEAALQPDELMPGPSLEHFARSAVFPALHETTRDGLTVGGADLVELAREDRLDDGFRGDPGDPEGQGSFDDQVDRQEGAETERPDESAGTLDEGLHIASVGKPPEVASPPFKLPLNADFMTLNDFI